MIPGWMITFHNNKKQKKRKYSVLTRILWFRSRNTKKKVKEAMDNNQMFQYSNHRTIYVRFQAIQDFRSSKHQTFHYLKQGTVVRFKHHLQQRSTTHKLHKIWRLKLKIEMFGEEVKICKQQSNENQKPVPASFYSSWTSFQILQTEICYKKIKSRDSTQGLARDQLTALTIIFFSKEQINILY